MKIKESKSEIFMMLIVYTVMIITVIVTAYPFLNVLAQSLNDAQDTIKGTNFIIPRKFTLDNYITIFSSKRSNLPHATMVSILRTVIGAVTTTFCCTMYAYVVSRDDFILKKELNMYIILTMYVGGGMIPVYMLIKQIGLLGSFWVYIIPGLISAYNVILIRSYIKTSIPASLEESAKIDGANDLFIFLRIIFPLSIPILATIALFTAVGQWNSWFDTYLYGAGKKELNTLQYELMKILNNASTITGSQGPTSAAEMEKLTQNATTSPQSIKMAITMVATIPIVCVYPFLQKYFITGLTLGAVKS